MFYFVQIVREYLFGSSCHLFSRSIFLVSVFWLMLSLASCRKDNALPDVLPPISDNGSNTFGAVVNGELIAVRGEENFSGGLYADPAEDSCFGCWNPPDSSDLFIRIKHPKFPITYIYLSDPRHTSEWSLNQPSQPFWETNKPKPYIEIKGRRSGITTEGVIRSDFHQRTDWIFSAEFNFHCVNPKTCEEFSVKDGRIDVNLRSIEHTP